MEEMRKAGVYRATFGVGAADKMDPVENLSGFRTKALAEAYSPIVKAFHLTNKSDYRRKFGAIDEPLYVAYPKGGLGLKGIEAIINSVRDKPKKAEKKLRRSGVEKVHKGGDSTKSGKTSSFHLPFHHHSHHHRDGSISHKLKSDSTSTSPRKVGSIPSLKVGGRGGTGSSSDTTR